MAARWRIRDVVDLEALVEADRDVDESAAAARDRGIFQERLAGAAGTGSVSARERMRCWLEARRAAGAGGAGDIYAGAMSLLGWILFFAGLLIGCGLAAGLLVFGGDRPISVTVFLSATVVWQVIAWVAVVLVWCFGGAARGAAAQLLGAVVGWIGGRLDGAGRGRFTAVWGALRARRIVYGDLFWWPLILRTQVFAVAFNVGLLATTLWLVAISNRAFGWETTLPLEAGTMYRIVETIAWPWSALGLPAAHPSMEAVAGSRIALQGGEVYATDAVTAWWPFLCYALAFYGLLPRAVLLLGALGFQHRALRRLDFRHGDCARILDRMTPVVAGEPDPDGEPTSGPEEPERPVKGSGPVGVVLVSRELNENARDAALTGNGWAAAQQIAVEVDRADANGATLEQLVNLPGDIAVLVEASRPPVRAVLAFIAAVRLAAGPQRGVLIFPIVEDGERDYRTVWNEAVAGMGDPYLWLKG